MVALWLFVSDRDVLSLQRCEHGDDVVEGKLVVISGNAERTSYNTRTFYLDW